MRFVKWILSKKAQILYSVLVLAFNIIAVYYLFFFSNNKIDLSSVIPTTSAFLLGIEKPIQDLWGKFVFTKTSLPHHYPAPLPTSTVVPSISPQPTEKDILINCVGPDGKYSFLTQKDCDTFNAAWHVATLSAQPTTQPTTSSATLQ